MAEQHTLPAEEQTPESSPSTAGVIPVTLFAVVVCVLGIGFISFFAHWYEVVVFNMGWQRQIIVNTVTPLVFFLMFLLVAVVNPLCHVFAPFLRLRQRHLLYILAMWLLTGAVCYKGLGAPVLNTIGNTYNIAVQKPLTKRADVLSYENPKLFLPPEAARKYYYGLSDGLTRLNPIPRSPALEPSDIRDLPRMAEALQKPATELSRYLSKHLSKAAIKDMAAYVATYQRLPEALASNLNTILGGPIIYEKRRFAEVKISDTASQKINLLLLKAVSGPCLVDRGPGTIEIAEGRANELFKKFSAGKTPVNAAIWAMVPAAVQNAIKPLASVAESADAEAAVRTAAKAQLQETLTDQLTSIMHGSIIYDKKTFADVAIAPKTAFEINTILLKETVGSDYAAKPGGRVVVADLHRPSIIAERLWSGQNPADAFLRDQFSEEGHTLLRKLDRDGTALRKNLCRDINPILKDGLLGEKVGYTALDTRVDTRRLINRRFLTTAYAGLIEKNPLPVPWSFRAEDFTELPALVKALLDNGNPVSRVLSEGNPNAPEAPKLSPVALQAMRTYLEKVSDPWPTPDDLAEYKIDIESAETQVRRAEEKARSAIEEALAEKKSGAGEMSVEAQVAKDPTVMAARKALTEAKGKLDKAQTTIAAKQKATQNAEKALVGGLDAVLDGPVLFSAGAFPTVRFSADTNLLINRLLVDDGYPTAMRPLPPQIPWLQWVGPLLFWVPFMLVVVIFSSTLIQMVHRQWSQHELISYPIADFAGSYIEQQPGRAFPKIFYDRIFWIGFAVVSFIFITIGLHQWVPLMVRLPLSFAHTSLVREFPFLNKYCGREAYSLFRGTAYPFMVALAVLLPTEVSLSAWFGWVLTIFSIGGYFMVTGEVIGATETGYLQYGMYVAMFVMILVIGRREYANILRYAFASLRRPKDELLHRAVIACRIFVLAFVALVLLLVYSGMYWFVALVLTCAFALMLILIARMTAELGIPWLVSFAGMARAWPAKMLGATLIGPQSLAVLAVVGGVLDANTENVIASQETTIRKIGEGRHGIRGSSWRFNLVLLLGMCVALGATIFFNLWDNYSFGSQKEASARNQVVNNMEEAGREINMLSIEGKTTANEGVGFFRRLHNSQALEGYWKFFIYGAVVIVFIMLMRLRFTWWPFHPLPFLLIGTWCLSRMCFSIFLGWLIKIALLKIGGGKVFARAKPFFIGVIVGQVVMLGVFVASGAIFYLITGRTPPSFNFFY